MTHLCHKPVGGGAEIPQCSSLPAAPSGGMLRAEHRWLRAPQFRYFCPDEAGARNQAARFHHALGGAATWPLAARAAERLLKVAPIIAAVHSDVEIETVIVALGREPRGGLVIIPNIFTLAHRAPIISAVAQTAAAPIPALGAIEPKRDLKRLLSAACLV